MKSLLCKTCERCILFDLGFIRDSMGAYLSIRKWLLHCLVYGNISIYFIPMHTNSSTEVYYMQFCANIFYNFVSNTFILTHTQNFRNSIIFECRKWNFIASNTGKNTIKIKCKPFQKFNGWTAQTFVDLYLPNTNSTMLFLHLTNVSAKFYGEFN